MIQIVNFSGGKDSTAMLHLMLDRGEQIDDVIFFDGGWDWPQMYDHIDEVERKTGITISRVKPPKDFNYWFCEHEYTSTKRGNVIGYGWPGVISRWCTRIKTDTIKNYIKGKWLFQEVTKCVGFAVGEEKRSARKGVAQGCRFPLIEWNYDENDCKRLCYSLGYTFGGLYDFFDRVSCFCCPLQSKKDMFLKKRHFPEQWDKIREMDQKIISIRDTHGQPPPPPFRNGEPLLQIDLKIRGKD